ncbi:YrrS family protein [Sporosarcina sp. FSL K6-2383]|uniref:YrrS family protein n=1 Tax=Sporosarcina sp. FSL K6-2383 TaxID=2921556 RepID=UPI00315B3516
MAEREPDFSRSGRNRNRRGSSMLLNMLIGVVVLLIIIVAAIIFINGNNEEKVDNGEMITTDGVDNPSDEVTSPILEDEDTSAEDDEAVEEPVVEDSTSDPTTEQPEAIVEPDPEMDEEGDGASAGGSVTYVTSDDEIIAETVINAAWQPIGTTQTGEHASQYDGESVDWTEKQQALAYATGLSQDSMIFWKIKNGGDPQKSVGIVSTKDKVEKYRVYLEWVDGEGWKPVKMDVLKTLEFEY